MNKQRIMNKTKTLVEIESISSSKLTCFKKKKKKQWSKDPCLNLDSVKPSGPVAREMMVTQGCRKHQPRETSEHA